MLIPHGIKRIAPYISIIGSSYGFCKTCYRVYNSTSPSKAIIEGVKGVVIDCIPPVIKYSLLCAAAIGCAGCVIVTNR